MEVYIDEAPFLPFLLPLLLSVFRDCQDGVLPVRDAFSDRSVEHLGGGGGGRVRREVLPGQVCRCQHNAALKEIGGETRIS